MFNKSFMVKVVLLSLFVVALLTAFGVSAQEQVTISFWHHYNAQSPENEKLNSLLIPAFEKKHP
ncbi:MAG TPA: hypothetical protein DD789_10885, partial [Firmicutes bacterium]|nr:hypothetical protein [Bacillota bacterium]